MPIKKNGFEARLEQALSDKPKLPKVFEAALFGKAEDLLSKRRERIATRAAESRQMVLARQRWIAAIRRASSRSLEFLAMHPDRPATAAIFAVLIGTFLVLHGGGRDTEVPLRYGDLPPFPKSNDFPARYDAQTLAERQTYEREVQDAHGKTSGGI